MSDRYQDLENMLFRGFIPLKMKVNGYNFVFKSVNEDEYEKIKLLSGIKDDPRYNILFNINYLFYSIYMVEGMNILNKRDEHYIEFFDVLKQFPAAFFNTISKNFEELAKKQSDCVILVEQYALENQSRYQWKARKNYLLNSYTQTGVLGTDLLGINQFQKFWTVLNLREDEKESFDEKYSLFKFLASFTDPKAVKKIDQQDKVRKEEEEERRERLRVMGTKDELQYLSSPADTREGIIKQLEDQMAGIKDDHDRIIEEYEKKIRMDALKKMQDLQKAREARRKEIEGNDGETKAISKEELQERLERLKERKSKPMYQSEVSPEVSAKFYQMSNIDDEKIIREEDFITEDEYKKLTGDELYQSMTGQKEKDEKEEAEKEYQKQQRTLASKYGIEDDINMDFPHMYKEK